LFRLLYIDFEIKTPSSGVHISRFSSFRVDVGACACGGNNYYIKGEFPQVPGMPRFKDSAESETSQPSRIRLGPL